MCLPPNATNLMQPLDVAFFAPLKKYWREILQQWKKKEGQYIPAITKDWFPRLLSRLYARLEMNNRGSENLIAAEYLPLVSVLHYVRYWTEFCRTVSFHLQQVSESVVFILWTQNNQRPTYRTIGK